MSRVSRAINTAFVERQNGTDRHRNARKARKTYRFSKDWRYHEAVTYLTLYSYNFCWPVRTLAVRDERGPLAATDPGDGGGLDRSRLVDGRMVHLAGRATLLGHEACRPRAARRIGVESGVSRRQMASSGASGGTHRLKSSVTTRAAWPSTSEPSPSAVAVGTLEEERLVVEAEEVEESGVVALCWRSRPLLSLECGGWEEP